MWVCGAAGLPLLTCIPSSLPLWHSSQLQGSHSGPASAKKQNAEADNSLNFGRLFIILSWAPQCCWSFAFCITYALRFCCPGVVLAFRPHGVDTEAASAISSWGNNLNVATNKIYRARLNLPGNKIAFWLPICIHRRSLIFHGTLLISSSHIRWS